DLLQSAVVVRRRKSGIFELCEIESTQPSLKEHRAKSFFPKQQPSAIVSSAKVETESENGHLSKSKCCSSDESEPKVGVVQEKQEIEEDKLGFSEGGVVCKKGQELKDCEVGLSENQEIGEASSIESVVDAVKIKEEFHNLSWAVDGNWKLMDNPNRSGPTQKNGLGLV
ncbi:hypothetical protein U1Q18_007778, partial [Sarracenia purpurea var. burkii]